MDQVKIRITSSTWFFDPQLGGLVHAVDGALVSEENRLQMLAAWTGRE